MLIKQISKQDQCDEFIVICFVQALNRQWIHIAERTITSYTGIILKYETRVFGHLLSSMTSSPYSMDLKLDMVRKFMPKMFFYNVDMLVDAIRKLVSEA